MSQDFTKSKSAAEDQSSPTFEQLMNRLKEAVNEFQNNSSPEKFAKIVTVLSAFGISGQDIWNKITSFARKHPVQSGVAAALIFFAYKGLILSADSRPRLQDPAYH